jgi:hypothetical protein
VTTPDGKATVGFVAVDGPGFDVEPPSDPEEWSDEQWIAWLRATDGAGDAPESHPPVTVGSRLAHSAGGSVLGEAMLALSQAMYGRRDDEVVIVVDGGAADAPDVDYELHLDPDHPERSSVVFRHHTETQSD